MLFFLLTKKKQQSESILHLFLKNKSGILAGKRRRREQAALMEYNLAQLPSATCSVSHQHPIGGGSSDPNVLLNERAHLLDGGDLNQFDRSLTYDTYGGQQRTLTEDVNWYAIAFPEEQVINCIEMTMGYPHRDGGWWTSLSVEYRTNDAPEWRPVENLVMTPPYDFRDARGERRPFTTHILTFPLIKARQIRLIGQPGGISRLTSLARIGVFHRDLSRWNPLLLGNPPVPKALRLLPPHLVFDLSEHLAEVTGLITAVPLLEYYLDEFRYTRFWQRLSRNYQGMPELWFLLGEHMGWNTWNHMSQTPTEAGPDLHTIKTPYVQPFYHDTFGYAIAPVIVDGQWMTTLSATTAILKDHFDESWHKQHALQLGIPWEHYHAAIERTPQLTWRQLQATAELLGMIANTIANLAPHLLRTPESKEGRGQDRKEIVYRAIHFMETHLEDRVTISDVAREVAFTLPYFSTLFTEEMGQSPSDFLIQLRIERAKEFFQHTALSVNDVADVLGYSPSHFSRVFKQRTGFAPHTYLVQARSNPVS